MRLLAVGLVIWQPARASARETPVLADAIAAEYVKPHQLVDVGGRRLNLICMGEGQRTVLFEAGGSDWSAIWALVQPAVAARARACAYDRAGLGYSDPASDGRAPIDIVEDLHRLVRAAGLSTPFVLVGHSLGGFDAKLYAAVHPEDVAGLVLLDPSEDRTDARTRGTMRRRLGVAAAVRGELIGRSGLRALFARYAACAAAARVVPLDPASEFYRRCSDPVRPALGPLIAAERARIQVTAAYQDAQAAELADSVYGRDDDDESYSALFRRGSLGTRPLIVLSHGEHDATDPEDAADFEAGIAMHRETAALSRRGELRVVERSGHNIEIDRPNAVIAAVDDVLVALEQQRSASARDARRPAPPAARRRSSR